jgi:hypothetical protein
MNSANPLLAPLRRLFKELSLLRGLRAHLEVQLTICRSVATPLSIGNWLVISDLTARPDDWTLREYPVERFDSTCEEFGKLALDHICRNASWVVAQGWERFESFLMDIGAAYLVNYDNTDVDFVGKEKYSAKWGRPSDYTSWRKFVKSRRGKNNCELLDFLRSLGPHLREAERANDLNLDLGAWYETVALVRHAVTHSDCVVPESSLDASKSSALREKFSGEFGEQGYKLLVRPSEADEALQTFATYGFSVFKSLSIATNLEWGIFACGLLVDSCQP